jgi:hypothetical protein
MGLFTPDASNYAFGGSGPQLDLSLSAKQQKALPGFIKAIKNYKPLARTSTPMKTMPYKRPAGLTRMLAPK